MRFIKGISLFIVICGFFAIGCYLGAGYEELFYPGNNSAGVKTQSVSGTVQRITADTVYHIVELDEADTIISESFEHAPQKYIGMTLTEFTDSIQQFNKAPSLKQREKGFLSETIETFSRDEVLLYRRYADDTVRETKPDELTKNSGFYISILNHYVVVYKSDQKTVYLKTEIHADYLPDEIQAELIKQKFFQTEEEVYDFLESYSS